MILQKKNGLRHFEDLIQVTFLDLILKSVLSIYSEAQQLHENDPINYVDYIITGANFKTFSAKPHEEIFIKMFSNKTGRKVLINKYARLIYRDTFGVISYQKKILASPHIDHLLDISFFNSLMNSYSLTDEGKRIVYQSKKAIKSIEVDLKRKIRSKDISILKDICVIGGNYFLTKNFKPTDLYKLEKSFRKIDFPKGFQLPVEGIFYHQFFKSFNRTKEFYEAILQFFTFLEREFVVPHQERPPNY